MPPPVKPPGSAPALSPYAPPQAALEVAGEGLTLWRQGKLVVMVPDTGLPQRCVRCNAPARKMYARELSWHRPGWYLLVLLGPLVYLPVAILVRYKATLRYGLCGRHRSWRLWAYAMTAAAMLIFLGGLYAVCTATDINAGSGVFFAGLAIYAAVGLLATLINGRLSPRAKRFTKQHLYVKGCAPAFLDSLPELPAELSTRR